MSETTHYIRIWDLPTRTFHWLLVGTFVLAWLSQGDDRYLDIHVFSGYLLLGLLAFRIGWGFLGSYYARFNHFPFGWQAVWHYLTTLPTAQRQRFMGHNPIGSWAILVILGFGFMVSLTGLLTLGGEEQHGVFAGWIDFAWGEFFHQWHEIIAWLMLGLIGIHVVGVVLESVLHQENLVKAMITGTKVKVPDHVLVPNHRLLAITLVIVILITSGSYFSGYLTQTSPQPYLPFIGPQLPDNPLWREACGECHLAYHPTLLPARSWQRMLIEQHEHFDEDLDLDEETLADIRTFLIHYAAESYLTEAAWKTYQSTPMEQTPLRVTETPYWQEQHRNISKKIW